MTVLFTTTGIRVIACIIIFLAGCQHAGPMKTTTSDCLEFEKGMNLSYPIETLNLLADAFSQKCDAVVITYGARAQTEFKYKTYSVVKESTSIFIPDGVLTAYILESYERGYLNVLVASSYLRGSKIEDAKVELRRLDQELYSPIYNWGEDPINLILSAVLWEQLGEPGEARVDWLRLRDQGGSLKTVEPAIQSFAERQMTRIDQEEPDKPTWQIYGIGRFPDVEWDLKFFGSRDGYFEVWPREKFWPVCVSETGIRLPTQQWFDKIAIRHNHAYHPLLNVQSWIRLPFGTLYSLVPIAAGAGLVVGGCAADVKGKSNGTLCGLSIKGGVALMMQAPKVLKGTLKPDLRHWERLPSAFVITKASQLKDETCLDGLPDRDISEAIKF